VFVVSPDTGFLPRTDPIDTPPAFPRLHELLEEMTLTRENGQPGLLARGAFGKAVEERLPLYDVAHINDQAELMALFRDYTFAASAYLLEPCDIMNRAKGKYGLGRQTLPKNIAVPLAQVSDKIHAKPFMEYAQSYALYNYKRIDSEKPLDFDNLELLRKFSGMRSEHGFILIHVSMVRYTPQLVGSVIEAMDACSKKDRAAFNAGLGKMVAVMNKINAVMEEMWKESAPEDYLKFRTFIMGIKDQTEMFPHGVVYEGVDQDPKAFRGESGANDSIIPTCDNFLQLTWQMPNNPMTEILRDFRSYRPHDHNKWLQWVDASAKELSVESFCSTDAQSLFLYTQLLDQVRDFRNRHWNFAKEYIIKRTAYPKATGGSPMATWLPNQLSIVLQKIQEKCVQLAALESGLSLKERELVHAMNDRADAQHRVLQKDVATFKKKFSQ
jgi:indoleamine 2,3-dioxygenase